MLLKVIVILFINYNERGFILNNSKSNDKQWTTIISSKKKRLNLGFKDLIEYKDLIYLFFKRDFTALYKQTVLGPVWYLIQPLFTTVVFAFIFGNLAGMGTEGTPSYLFYLSGIILWRLFSDTLSKTSKTFIANQGIFGKVYFPRLTSPVSAIGANLVAFGIQLLLLVLIFIYYIFNGLSISLSWAILLAPLVILQVCMLSLGIGLIITSVTTKYRDLQFVVGFIMQLWMYATPVAYPLSELMGKVSSSISWFFWINPIAFPIELFRFMLFQNNQLNWMQGLVSIIITFVSFIWGISIFNKVERDFMDRI